MESFKKGLGRHYLVEFYECSAEILDDDVILKEAMLKAAEISGATIIDSVFHRFAPQGFSGVVVIAESHFSIHTWPENNYAAVDLFTCSPKMMVERALDFLAESIECQHTEVKEVERGIDAIDSSED